LHEANLSKAVIFAKGIQKRPILIAVCVLGPFIITCLILSTSLEPTSYFYVIIRYGRLIILFSCLLGAIVGSLGLVLAPSFHHSTKLSTTLFLSTSILVIVITPGGLMYENAFKIRRWDTWSCDGFDGTVVLTMFWNPDRGSTLSFSQGLGGQTFILYRSVQGIHELMADDRSSTAVSFNLRGTPTYNVPNSSISGVIEENPVQFGAFGLRSVWWFSERCYAMSAIFEDGLENTVVKTGIWVEGKSGVEMKLCMRGTGLDEDGRVVVAGYILAMLEKVWEQCKGRRWD
jgi:hypothetical protein